MAFIGSNLKLKRARQHIAALSELLDGYLDRNPLKGKVEQVVTSADGSEGEITVTIIAPEPPEMASAILGDAIHNMRTALDLMAAEMARMRTNNDDGVYFPFGNDAAGLEEMIKRKQFNRCGQEAVDLLRSIQPYKGGNVQLRAIHDLDIMDKHIALIPDALITTEAQFETYNLTGDPADLQWGDPKLTNAEYTFPTGTDLAGRPLLAELESLVKLCESILESFASLQPSDEERGNAGANGSAQPKPL